ncbi:unnamed protein product [Cylindrotheca closterium]|uniref:Uncharacterized protein n=1 Tax=Cylindrotheca closterium TaxID=2856 RepID=A0AAD2FXI6_9STRA|nr:unnamed protein product [Cylindrotheca closterium]
MSTVANLVLQSKRLLDGDNPDDGDQDSGMSPTASPSSDSAGAPMEGDADSLAGKYGLAALILVGVGLVLLLWQSCKRWQMRRERQLLQIQSSRADAVLGDMQMVPADDDYDDDDDDPELL